MEQHQFIFRPAEKARLSQFRPDTTGDFSGEQDAQASVHENAERLAKYQDMLMAHETHGLLILFQGMDASGKDEAIKYVMANVDPQGCEVKLFKEPTEKEIRHDYLWRAVLALPARGQIGIFNRSYYEHVVAERVHWDQVERQNLPDEAKDGIWDKRFRQINHFEKYLVENGIHILKFFLHISEEEQRKRLLERISRPEKRWQFSMDDVEERVHWDEYMKAYEEAFAQTSTDRAPWYVIPADHRWFARAMVAALIVAKLESLHSDYPSPSDEEREKIEKARKILENKTPER